MISQFESKCSNFSCEKVSTIVSFVDQIIIFPAMLILDIGQYQACETKPIELILFFKKRLWWSEEINPIRYRSDEYCSIHFVMD